MIRVGKDAVRVVDMSVLQPVSVQSVPVVEAEPEVVKVCLESEVADAVDTVEPVEEPVEQSEPVVVEEKPVVEPEVEVKKPKGRSKKTK